MALKQVSVLYQMEDWQEVASTSSRGYGTIHPFIHTRLYYFITLRVEEMIVSK